MIGPKIDVGAFTLTRTTMIVTIPWFIMFLNSNLS
jgi:hypothetical protein